VLGRLKQTTTAAMPRLSYALTPTLSLQLYVSHTPVRVQTGLSTIQGLEQGREEFRPHGVEYFPRQGLLLAESVISRATVESVAGPEWICSVEDKHR
jgi:hypothetical protein